MVFMNLGLRTGGLEMTVGYPIVLETQQMNELRSGIGIDTNHPQRRKGVEAVVRLRVVHIAKKQDTAAAKAPTDQISHKAATDARDPILPDALHPPLPAHANGLPTGGGVLRICLHHQVVGAPDLQFRGKAVILSLETRGRQKMDSRIMESSRRSPRIIDRYAPPSPRHRAYMGARSQQHSPHRRPRAANSSKTSSPTSRPLSAQDSQSNVLHKMVPPSSPDKSQSIEVSNGYPPSKTKGLSRELDAKERKMENPPASPPRPIPSFADSPNSPDPVRLEDSVHLRDAFPLHGMNANNIHRGPPRPHIETQQPSPVHQYPASQPSYRQANYSPQNGPPPQSQYYSALPQHGQYTASQGSMPTGFQGQPSHPNHQVFHPQYSPDQERRFSGPPAPTPSPKFPSQTRGSIGQFNNQHWNANNRVPSRTRYEQHSSSARQLVPSIEKSPSPPTQIAPTEDVEAEQRVNLPPVPSSPAVIETKAEPQIYADIGSSAQVTSQAPTKAPAKEVVKNVEENPVKITIASNKISMPPPSRPSPASRTPQPAAQEKGGSKFSFAFKAKAAPSPKPDLLTKLREPVLRPSTILRGEVSKKSHSRTTSRESHSQSSREAPAVEMKILKRIKPRPTIDPQFVSSDSVYFRKPGNESVIGSGTYGKVFKGIHVYTKDLVALKKIRMEGERDGFPVTAIREIKLLQSIKHENVVSLREVMVEKNDCFMVFEYLSHDLTGLLNHPSFKLESSHKKHLAKQMFDGLNYLHRQGVLHRDIKAANILISSEGKLKLADFGLARFFVKRRQLDYTNRVITIWYRSPELLLGETQYGPAVDIWSAACVLIEIFTKHAIFPGDGGEINQLDKIYNILGTPTRSEWPGLVDMAWFELLRPTERKKNVFADKYKERLTPAAFDLLSAMFLYDPAKRPSASDVLEHPYFTVEDPAPKQAIELRDLSGDWHEYESKALRKEKERKEARKASTKEKEKEKEKRRASVAMSAERDAKRQQIVATTYLGKAA
ncbi:MAG: kinase subunit of RNA polymerase II carboxy-terminal domain kinase I [Trizodia sp. TS-e1964]|nr:MAG: kinase subunit of RNA polymerase II carboxy-terminal domain kinase I [Trizodia sp. TS-e1964]